jgi:hypothetical protein
MSSDKIADVWEAAFGMADGSVQPLELPLHKWHLCLLVSVVTRQQLIVGALRSVMLAFLL